jgi:hypothetical protein
MTTHGLRSKLQSTTATPETGPRQLGGRLRTFGKFLLCTSGERLLFRVEFNRLGHELIAIAFKFDCDLAVAARATEASLRPFEKIFRR